jgi:hypothetical protein
MAPRVIYRITNGRSYDRSATNSDDNGHDSTRSDGNMGDDNTRSDGNGDDNTRRSKLRNEDRSRSLLCRLAPSERRKRQTLELKQEVRHRLQQPQMLVLFYS